MSLQRKSSRNLTPFSGSFIKWIKLCRSITRWRCLSKLYCHKSLKRGPQGKNVKGLNLLDLSMATIWYHSIVSTGHIAILQTNYVVQFFQLTIAPSRLGRSVGRSTTHFSQMVDPCTDLSSNNPRTKNLGTVVAPLGGPRGERMRSGGGLWE